jgi:hypothetical protein
MIEPPISKATLKWSRDYDHNHVCGRDAYVEHPAIFRKLRIPYKVINGCAQPTPMLVRYRLLDTPWGSLNVHHFLRGDEDRELHDHPFAFATLILKGGYLEELPYPRMRVIRWPGSILFRPAKWTHRVDLLGSGAWTLIAMTKKQREWGFHTAGGWMPFREYHSIAGCAEE